MFICKSSLICILIIHVQYTEEETKRALERREQNRKAAQRFRMRQKDTSHRLLKVPIC